MPQRKAPSASVGAFLLLLTKVLTSYVNNGILAAAQFDNIRGGKFVEIKLIVTEERPIFDSTLPDGVYACMHKDKAVGWSVALTKRENGVAKNSTHFTTGISSIERISILNCIKEAIKAGASELVLWTTALPKVHEACANITGHTFHVEAPKNPPSLPMEIQ